MTRTPWTLGERVVLGVACGLLISLYILAILPVIIPGFNIWGPITEIEVTPTGYRTWVSKYGTEYGKVVERGESGLFYITGNIPDEMVLGVTYRLTIRRGRIAPRFAKYRSIYKVEKWVAQDE